MINGLHHVAISTADLDRLSDFYVEALGFELIYRGGWKDQDKHDRLMQLEDSAGRAAMLRAGNLYIEMFEFARPPSADARDARRANDRGLVHIALDVTGVEQEYERLKAAGMEFHCPPQSFHDGRIVTTYGRDPDGNIVELQEIRSAQVPFGFPALKVAT